MPYIIHKVSNGYQVVNPLTGRIHSKHTSKKKAQAQVRLLFSKEHRP